MELEWSKYNKAYLRKDGTLPGSTLKNFGDMLRLQRTGYGYTQTQLADACGISRTYLNGIEMGKRNPTLKTLIKIAAALKLPLEHLLTF